MATAEWIQFFQEAGIPPGPALSYALMFVDNRIQKNMLLDLNKELINELGITVVGDIIAILKHAKVVYRQEMCKVATELLHPSSPSIPSEPRRQTSTAARMITNSLSRDSPPTPPRAPRISVTVATKAGARSVPAPVKRRRVTAEMEGKYIITMPKGTTPRSRKILEQQAAKGVQRTSVFQRLGSEAPAASPGAKPTGVFSRLGEASGPGGDSDGDSDGDTALPYAGVLKRPPPAPRPDNPSPGRPVRAKATTSSEAAVTAAGGTRLLTAAGGVQVTAGGGGTRAVTAGGGARVAAVPAGGGARVTAVPASGGARVTAMPTSGGARVTAVPASGGARVTAMPTSGGARVTAGGGTRVTAMPAGGGARVTAMPAGGGARVTAMPASGGARVTAMPAGGSTRVPAMPASGGARVPAVPAAQDGDVSSSRGRGLRLRRSWGCGAVSSSSDGAQMDNAAAVSVFRRLGRKAE